MFGSLGLSMKILLTQAPLGQVIIMPSPGIRPQEPNEDEFENFIGLL